MSDAFYDRFLKKKETELCCRRGLFGFSEGRNNGDNHRDQENGFEALMVPKPLAAGCCIETPLPK